MPRGTKQLSLGVPRPEVIIDFNCSQGLLFILLKNIGTGSAYNVRTVFDQPFRGLGGAKCISDLQLFRCVESVPPGKEFIVILFPFCRFLK